MKHEQVQELLAKYYDGRSTQSEEDQLLDYFASGVVSAEFKRDRDIFLSLSTMSVENEPDLNLKTRIESRFFEKIKTHKSHKYKSIYLTVLSSAAVMLLAVTLWFTVESQKGPADTFSSPELAYEETLKALHRVSAGMNGGTSKLKPLESLNVVNEGIKNLGNRGNLLERGFIEIETLQRHLEIKELDNK
jgi:hypothetical protein